MALGIEPDIFISAAREDDHCDAGIFFRVGLVDIISGGGDITIDTAGAEWGIGVGVIVGAHGVLVFVFYDVIFEAGGVEEIFRCDEVVTGGGVGDGERGEQKKDSELFHFWISFLVPVPVIDTLEVSVVGEYADGDDCEGVDDCSGFEVAAEGLFFGGEGDVCVDAAIDYVAVYVEQVGGDIIGEVDGVGRVGAGGDGVEVVVGERADAGEDDSVFDVLLLDGFFEALEEVIAVFEADDDDSVKAGGDCVGIGRGGGRGVEGGGGAAAGGGDDERYEQEGK